MNRYLSERLRRLGTVAALLVAWVLTVSLCVQCFAALWRAVAAAR
jgi:hypothetical protein